jgi:hypothetical protein
MSVAWPCIPPSGWWIMTLELGSAKRLPLAPAASRKAPMLAAMPVHRVDTSGLMKFMVSKIAMPALTLPPGLLM